RQVEVDELGVPVLVDLGERLERGGVELCCAAAPARDLRGQYRPARPVSTTFGAAGGDHPRAAAAGVAGEVPDGDAAVGAHVGLACARDRCPARRSSGNRGGRGHGARIAPGSLLPRAAAPARRRRRKRAGPRVAVRSGAPRVYAGGSRVRTVVAAVRDAPIVRSPRSPTSTRTPPPSSARCPPRATRIRGTCARHTPSVSPPRGGGSSCGTRTSTPPQRTPTSRRCWTPWPGR